MNMVAEAPYQFPHRKPMPQIPSSRHSTYAHLQPEQQYLSISTTPSSTFSHSRTRTTSSSLFPAGHTPPQQNFLYTPANMQTYSSRRTPSTGTASTFASSGNGPVPVRQDSNALRRSTSSRSGGAPQPTGYVALMRKQKATVWCDRAQHEDPRLMAQQRAAKMRAVMEVIGGHGTTGRTSTSGSGSIVGSNRVTAKIRHHGKAGLVGYSPAELVGGVGGVPMRLSATEVEGESSDDEGSANGHALYHQRTGSGRSSLGSGRRGPTHGRPGGKRYSSGNTPPNERGSPTNADTVETPVPVGHVRVRDHVIVNDSESGRSHSSSLEKGHSEVDLQSAARMASNSLLKATITREKSVKNPEELRRRGSVDERTATMTLSAGRLYIANPDEDSD